MNDLYRLKQLSGIDVGEDMVEDTDVIEIDDGTREDLYAVWLKINNQAEMIASQLDNHWDIAQRSENERLMDFYRETSDMADELSDKLLQMLTLFALDK